MTRTPPDPGLCLIAPAEAGADWLARVGAALAATKAQTLILTAPAEGAFDPAAVRALAASAQGRQVAALVADDVNAARAAGADGVHLSWRPDIGDAYAAARAALGRDAIVGVDAGASRHDAMTLGDAGADYVAFAPTSAAGTGSDDPDAPRETQSELVAWWSELFVVPVVAFGVGTAAEARDLVRHGADFIAVRFTPDARAAADDAAWAAPFVTALRASADAA